MLIIWTAYEAWLSSYCYVTPVSSNTWAVPSSYIPVPSSYPAPVPSSYPAPVPSSYPAPVPSSYPAPVPSSYPAPVPSSYPAPASSYYPDGSSVPYPSYSACTKSTTLIWRSSTSCVETVVTPSSYAAASGTAGGYDGSWGGSYAAASSYAVATGTGAAYPSQSQWAPVPATGAGAKLVGAGFGAAGLVAGVAAVLL